MFLKKMLKQNFLLPRCCSSLRTIRSNFCVDTISSRIDSSFKQEHLKQRRLVSVNGLDSLQFLQGLVTNDMNHLTRGNTSIYAMFLNKGGRVMYDSIIYKTGDENKFYVECDVEVVDQVVKHLKLFRVRRKIDVDAVNDKNVWVVFDDSAGKKSSILLPKKHGKDEIVCIDPRLKYLGTRLILEGDKDESYVKSLFEDKGSDIETSIENDYRKHRYSLGIGEGSTDLPNTKCFPLESNADFLNGVSFQKGCYVGQELTARTHHTGVVRKRLMPLKFSDTLKTVENLDTIDILNESDQKIGKLRGYCNGYGLALLRIELAIKSIKLLANGIECQTYKPLWWPQIEASR